METLTFKEYPVKALIATIEPIDGGVPTMTRWICSVLEDMNIQPVLAWYAPWSKYPSLSVPTYRVLRAKPRGVKGIALNQYEGSGIGAWLPEFEFTHYLPTKHWVDLIKSCHFHLSVSGNPLCATPFIFHKVPFMAWIATPWEADREIRVQKFKFPRRQIDTLINRPILRRLEKMILRNSDGIILSLSEYTGKEFEVLSGRKVDDVMIMPVNTDIFCRKKEMTIPWRIGFSGRYTDPRKNISLLLHTLHIIIDQEVNVELILMGDKNYKDILHLIDRVGVGKYVRCYAHQETGDLASLLQTLDLFVIPSHQEGLCIAALEAMACGVPVVSTRCGGPEEYVIPFQTGQIVDSTPEAVAQAILGICSSRDLRNKMSEGASNWIQTYASVSASKRIFTKHMSTLIDRSTKESMYERLSFRSSA